MSNIRFVFRRCARLPAILAMAGGLLIAGTCRGQAPPATAPAATQGAGAKPAAHAADGDELSATHHSITVNGKTIAYTATAGTLLLTNEADKPWGRFFYVAYQLDQGDSFDPRTRPITFVFNGGPGAAAVWLHLGALGPKRIDWPATNQPPDPPYRLIDNPQTWLNFTDLVFIDPVGTGYSRPAPGVDAKEFYGVNPDLDSIAAFIRLYTTRSQRWLSPKFLAGESYGTTRAAALAGRLLNRYGIDLSGIVLISSVLNFQTIEEGPANDLATAVFLPSLTAIAWYHHRLDPALQQDLGKTLDEVGRWTLGEYLPALAQGGKLPADQRSALLDHLARYTSLDRTFIARSNLRIYPYQFREKLLEDRGQIIGRFDARITGANPSPEGPEAQGNDPSLDRYLPAYTATFNDYVRRELKYSSDLNYEVLSGKVHWSFQGEGGYLNVADDLRSAILANPHLKVMFACGYFDTATPMLGTTYTINRMNLGPALTGNVTQKFYPGGHMLYHVAEARQALAADAAGFYRDCLPAPGAGEP
jgi:carboxypeptidase C (cathepsin A)